MSEVIEEVPITFKLLTHNLWCHYLTNAPNKQHRMEHFVRRIAEDQYDVILLQELFVMRIFGMLLAEQVQKYVEDELKKIGYIHKAVGVEPPYL